MLSKIMRRVLLRFGSETRIARHDQNAALVELTERWEASQRVGDELLFLLRTVGRDQCLCCNVATPDHCLCHEQVRLLMPRTGSDPMPTFFDLAMDRANGDEDLLAATWRILSGGEGRDAT